MSEAEFNQVCELCASDSEQPASLLICLYNEIVLSQ